MANIIEFTTPIQIPNSNDTVTTVNLDSIKDGLFFKSESAYYVTKTGLRNCKFISEIFYDSNADTLKCKNTLKDMELDKTYRTVSFMMNKEHIEHIFRSIIEEDEYIFDIDLISQHLNMSKESVKKDVFEDKGLLIFDGDIIEGMYGKSGDGVIFNRILFDNINKIFLAEVLFKDSKAESEGTIDMFLDNNMVLSINISSSNINGTSKTDIGYVCVQGLMSNITLTDNNQMDAKKFDTSRIQLPEFSKNATAESLEKELFIKNNYDDKILYNFYKTNKSFFAQRINILNYMLS